MKNVFMKYEKEMLDTLQKHDDKLEQMVLQCDNTTFSTDKLEKRFERLEKEYQGTT